MGRAGWKRSGHEMDGRIDRVWCEEGEARCDVCRASDTRYHDGRIGRNELSSRRSSEATSSVAEGPAVHERSQVPTVVFGPSDG